MESKIIIEEPKIQLQTLTLEHIVRPYKPLQGGEDGEIEDANVAYKGLLYKGLMENLRLDGDDLRGVVKLIKEESGNVIWEVSVPNYQDDEEFDMVILRKGKRFAYRPRVVESLAVCWYVALNSELLDAIFNPLNEEVKEVYSRLAKFQYVG